MPRRLNIPLGPTPSTSKLGPDAEPETLYVRVSARMAADFRAWAHRHGYLSMSEGLREAIRSAMEDRP